MSNSNFNITKVTVDKISQEITGLEINGKTVDLGEDFDVENLDFKFATDLPSTKLLETIEIQNAPVDYTYHIVVEYEEEEVGYITVREIAAEEP